MGFESFRVELRGGRTNYAEVEHKLQKRPQVKLDQHSPQTKGSTFYIVEDGWHVIEMELKDAPVRISCRFTLCHPTSVDSVFLELVHELMFRFGMDVWICDNVRPEDAHSFSLTQFGEFSCATLRSIAARRTEWIAAFGTEQMPATTNEVYERIILPRCQPVASWAEKR